MLDQWRFDCLGANANGSIQTPNLDSLAARSANFTQACVHAPVCVPSRLSFFTGRYQHSDKNRVNHTPCRQPAPVIQTLLKASGYSTGSVGKLHFNPQNTRGRPVSTRCSSMASVALTNTDDVR